MVGTITDRLTGINTSTAIKAPVKAATTAAITLSGEQTIDGVSCVTGDRVLVKNQASAIDNGIYIVDTSAWTRAADFNGSFDVRQGTQVRVSQGTINAGLSYAITTADTITIGTSEINFDLALFEFSGGIRFNYDTTTTMADPGSGDMRFNNATISSATAIAVSANTADSGAPDLSSFVATWDDSDSSVKGTLFLRKVGSASTFAIFNITGAVTDNTTWLELTSVAYLSGSGTFSSGDDISIIFSRAGNDGGGALDINGLTIDGTPDTAADYVATYDASAGSNKKVLLSTITTAAHTELIAKADTVITASDKIIFGDASDTNLPKTDTVQGILDLQNIVQVVYNSSASMTSGTAQIPVDDTIPQSGEGLEAVTATITPISATNDLVIFYQVNIANAGSNQTHVAALFQDSTASAIDASTAFEGVGGNVISVTGTHKMTAGTTSATTFKVRAGGESSVVVTLNGAAAARLFGGVMAHKILIMEIKV